MAVPAWVRIWLRGKETISDAMSGSRVRLSDADRVSAGTERCEIVCSNRFWYAARLARLVDTVVMAVLVVSMAEAALFPRSTLPRPVRAVLLTAEMLTEILSVVVLLAPTWKTPPEPVVT